MENDIPQSSIRSLYKASPVINMFFQFQKYDVTVEIDVLKNYIINNKQTIKDSQAELLRRVNEEIKKHPESEQDIVEFYEDQSNKTFDTFPSLYRNSTFLMIYAFLEYNLKHLVTNISSYTNIPKKFIEPSRSDKIQRYKNYLENDVGIDLRDMYKPWENIKKFQEIRNAFVHSNGSIRSDKTKKIEDLKLRSYIEENKFLELEEPFSIVRIKDDEFLLEFCKIADVYLNNVLERAEKEVYKNWLE